MMFRYYDLSDLIKSVQKYNDEIEAESKKNNFLKWAEKIEGADTLPVKTLKEWWNNTDVSSKTLNELLKKNVTVEKYCKVRDELKKELDDKVTEDEIKEVVLASDKNRKKIKNQLVEKKLLSKYIFNEEDLKLALKLGITGKDLKTADDNLREHNLKLRNAARDYMLQIWNVKRSVDFTNEAAYWMHCGLLGKDIKKLLDFKKETGIDYLKDEKEYDRVVSMFKKFDNFAEWYKMTGIIPKTEEEKMIAGVWLKYHAAGLELKEILLEK